MDTIEFFLKGIILGFAIAAPVGPIGILCIRKTMQYGRWSGLCSGLGAAFADMLYGIIAVFGLGLLSDIMIAGRIWLRLFGGIFLFILGLKTFYSEPKTETDPVTHVTLIKDFLSTFLLTLTNPLTVLAYVAIFAGLGITRDVSDYGPWLIFGVFLGSALWWTILSEGVTFFRKRFSHGLMKGINRTAGIILMSFGVAAVVSIIFH
jgi:threonine/homoserine/homoserine lactone efflux protein